MRILILTQYYPPETGAPQNRWSDLAEHLTRSGHEITILTALPNYPRGEIFKGYQGRLLIQENSANIKIIRTWIYATKSKSFVQRLLNYFSFVGSSFVVGVSKVRSQDVIIVESPPLFLGISGYLLSLFKRARLVFNVSDLWPDSAVAMGILKSKSLVILSRWLEEFLYKRSHLITGQTQGIINDIQSRVTDRPVALITNGVNVKAFLNTPRSEQKTEIRKELDFANKFVIGYAGLHGIAQGLETVIEAAHLLAEHKELLFAFFGEGPEKQKLSKLAHQFRLGNIRFYPSQTRSRMPAILGSFDVALIPLKKLDLFKGALPSKMFEAMAAAVPIILSIDGEARALINRAQAGICIEPENPKAMADAILHLSRDSDYRRALGQNGRKYVSEHYDRSRIAKNFEELLLRLHRSHSLSVPG